MKITDVTDLMGVTNTKKNQEVEPEKAEFKRENLGPKKTYLYWEAAPSTPTTSIDDRYKKTLLIIGAVVGLVLMVMGEVFLLLVIASLIFITYVMARNPLESFKYELNSHGVSVHGDHYYWDQMERFFFTKHFGDENLAVDLREGLPARLIIAFNHKDKEKIKDSINKHLPYLEEEPLNFADKAYTSVLDRFDFQKKK